VFDQGRRHIGEHGLAVFGRAVEATTTESVTHWLSPKSSGRRAKGRTVSLDFRRFPAGLCRSRSSGMESGFGKSQ
jgi:hypothetical protein